MELQNLNTSFSTATALTGAAAVLGAIIWWLVRKRRYRLWLPTLRVIDLETRQMPKMRLVPPPWLAFTCFLICSLAFVFFTLQPREQVYTPFQPQQSRLHIFLDLSPSVASKVSLTNYADEMVSLFEKMRSQGRVTLSTSHSSELHEFQTGDEVKKLIQTLGFHRAGVKLGETIKKQSETLGEIDRMFIVSDQDRFSWDDLNWSFLLEEMDVYHVPVSSITDNKEQNFYIDKVNFLSTLDGLTLEWELEIVVNNPVSRDTQGIVKASYDNKVIRSVPWVMHAGRERLTLRVDWPVSEMHLSGEQGLPVLWAIEPESEDKLELDNLFRTTLEGIKQDILIISEPTGEMFLEDPAHHLNVALAILGFRTRRLDRYHAEGLADAWDYPLWILLGGSGGNVQNFCPSSLMERLRQLRGSEQQINQKLPLVWLAPFDQGANYQDLCWCYDRLTSTLDPQSPLPTFCEDVKTREQWIGVLSSLGAKQIGGEVGDYGASVAWHYKYEKTGFEVLAYTVPLRPSLQTGVTYSALPLIVRSLVGWQGLLDGRSVSKKDQWPRILDISSAGAQGYLARDITLSNIPAGESELATIEEQLLPPRWVAHSDASGQATPARKDSEDPLPWLNLIALIITAACLLEGGVKTVTSVIKLALRKKSLLLLPLLLVPKTGKSEVLINLSGYQVEGNLASRLSREVASRTSIGLAQELLNTPGFSEDQSLNEPWLWVKGLQQIVDNQGRLRPALDRWLKRGGFLVIEGATDDTGLERMTTEFERLRRVDGWRAIPPDHELMRSFHLLDSLPVCPGQVWRGFHFDGRLAVLAIPYSFVETLLDQPKVVSCLKSDYERSTRVFINILMVALTTDYKKDQIHLPEILKRLR